MSMDKQVLKKLRAERKDLIAAAKDRLKRMRGEARLIHEALAKGPATIPQIAGMTGQASERVLWHVMAMKKFGQVAETGQDGDYFLYALEDQTN
jgi:predicted transcriptional regulator